VLSAALLVILAASPIDPPGTLDPKAEAAFDSAVKLRREGRFRPAAEAFEALAAAHPRARRAPHALAIAASIRLWQLGERDRAKALCDRVLAGPDDVPGLMLALTERLALERDRGGPKAELALVHTLYDRRKTASYAPYLLLRASRILEGDLDQPIAALVPVRRIVESFEGSSWADEATIAEARLLRKLGRSDEALRSYRRLIATHTESFIVGEYDSDFLDEAYFELADTLERDLTDGEAAEKAFLELVDEMPESIRVDDALHRAEAIARSRGDEKAAERYHQTLVRLRPASRFLK
jgi:tetratricopeptide (TPR) repeat protein